MLNTTTSTQDITSKAEKLFGLYVQRELNYCLRRFDFETSLKWREQLFENKDKIISAIEKDIKRGAYNGFYHYKK